MYYLLIIQGRLATQELAIVSSLHEVLKIIRDLAE